MSGFVPRRRIISREALDGLDPADRDALLLRYFEERDFTAVGDALGGSAEAARKRVDRALDRLRELLARRGITTTGAALGATLTAHAIEAVPPVFAAALAAGAATVAATAAAFGNTDWFANLMLMTKTKLAVLFVVRQNTLSELRAGNESLRRQTEARNSGVVPEPAAGLSPSSSVAPLSASERSELLRLRGQVSSLRTATGEASNRVARLREFGTFPPQRRPGRESREGRPGEPGAGRRR